MGFEFGETNYDSVSFFVYFLLRKMINWSASGTG